MSFDPFDKERGKHELEAEAEDKYEEEMSALKRLRGALDHGQKGVYVIDDSDGTGDVYLDVMINDHPFRLTLERA